MANYIYYIDLYIIQVCVYGVLYMGGGSLWHYANYISYIVLYSHCFFPDVEKPLIMWWAKRRARSLHRKTQSGLSAIPTHTSTLLCWMTDLSMTQTPANQQLRLCQRVGGVDAILLTGVPIIHPEHACHSSYEKNVKISFYVTSWPTTNTHSSPF